MFKRLQSGDASIFLICFLLSFFIWSVIALNTEKVYSFEIPVNYVLDSKHVLLNELPNSISISSSGEVANLISFQRHVNNHPISFDIKTSKSLDLKMQNDIIVKRLKSYELNLIQNHNDLIAIELDSIIERTIPVKSQITATSTPPYVILEQSVSPSAVKVKGPASVIYYIDSISTSKTEIKDLMSYYEDSIYLLKSLSNKLNFEQKKVLFKADVVALKSSSKTLSFAELGFDQLKYDSLELIYKSPPGYSFNANDINISIQSLPNGMDTFHINSNNSKLIDLITVPF